MWSKSSQSSAAGRPRRRGHDRRHRRATAKAFNAAGCASSTDDIALLSWRATRQAQAIGQVNQHDEPDELMKTVEQVAAALPGLLAAATLDKALTTGPGLKGLADLLGITD